MENKSLMNRWCGRTWIDFSLAIATVMTVIILMNWQEWSTELIIVAGIAVLLPLHVVEEWVFPGGFHYQYNFARRSGELDHYPMNRLTDMLTNLMGVFVYIGFAIYSLCHGGIVPRGVVLGTIGLSFLEVIIHTILGTIMYVHFRTAGKRTIYGPGSITAYFGWGVAGVVLCYGVEWSALTSMDWIGGAIVLLVGLLGMCIVLPEAVFCNHETSYAFPWAGYYERFLNDKEKSEKKIFDINK